MRALAPAVAAAATTTVTAAQVQIVDDDAHAAYKEGVSTGCSSPGACTVTFPAVPAGHRRLVEHLSDDRARHRVAVTLPGSTRSTGDPRGPN